MPGEVAYVLEKTTVTYAYNEYINFPPRRSQFQRDIQDFLQVLISSHLNKVWNTQDGGDVSSKKI